MTVLWIGVVDSHEQIAFAEETRKQMEELKKYEIDIVDPETEEPATWKDLDNPEEPRSLFQYIEGDRKKRKEHLMADRPPILIATIRDTKVIRIEFYVGHDSLRLEIDARTESLRNVDLEPTYKGG